MASALGEQLFQPLLKQPITAENGATCDNSAIDYLYKLGSSDLGNFGGSIPEQQRLAYDDLYFIERGFDEEEDDFDDVGLALRYYSEALNSTEFWPVLSKVNSRIPYASVRSLGPVAGWTTVGTTTDQTNRIAGTMGCMVAGAAGSAVNQAFKDFTIDDPDIMFLARPWPPQLMAPIFQRLLQHLARTPPTRRSLTMICQKQQLALWSLSNDV